MKISFTLPHIYIYLGKKIQRPKLNFASTGLVFTEIIDIKKKKKKKAG